MRIKIYQIGLIGDVDVDVATDADDRIDFTLLRRMSFCFHNNSIEKCRIQGKGVRVLNI